MEPPIHAAPRIRVLASHHGLFPSIQPLNPWMRGDRWTVRLELEIEWEPADPVGRLSKLETSLLAICPGLYAHRCGGPPEYHVRSFVARGHDGNSPPAVEPALALAHIIEHVMIDAVAFVTAASSVSGLTGARRDSTRRYDIFVECRDPAVGALARHVGVNWTTAILGGEIVPPERSRLLSVARWLYRRGPRVFEMGGLAAEAGLPSAEAERVVCELEEAGFASRRAFTMNFSGQRYYGVADAVG